MESTTLQELVDYGIVDERKLFADLAMAKKKVLLAKHESPIWYNDKNGRWYTHFPDETKKDKRILKSRKNKEDLESLIIKFYQAQEKPEVLTVNKVFELWITKKSANIKSQTVIRYRNVFKRYIEPTWFGKKDIRKLSLKDVDRFCSETIGQNQMTAKCWEGIRTDLIGIIKYAKTNELSTLSASDVKDIDVAKNAFKKRMLMPGEDVLTTQDIQKINSYIDEHMDDIELLGIRLVFKTGLRVGELSVLKYSDLNKAKKTLVISRTEEKVANPDKSGPKTIVSVREETKGAKGWREIVIDQATIDLIERIHAMNPDGEYLFEKDHQRINANCWTKRLPRICAKLGIGKLSEGHNYSLNKSMHKGRKNYASTLLHAGVEPKFVQLQLGHTDISTTMNYYNRDIENLEERSAALVPVLEKM